MKPAQLYTGAVLTAIGIPFLSAFVGFAARLVFFGIPTPFERVGAALFVGILATVIGLALLIDHEASQGENRL